MLFVLLEFIINIVFRLFYHYFYSLNFNVFSSLFKISWFCNFEVSMYLHLGHIYVDS